jgi:hypothetical protein
MPGFCYVPYFVLIFLCIGLTEPEPLRNCAQPSALLCEIKMRAQNCTGIQPTQVGCGSQLMFAVSGPGYGILLIF